jgi:uncharacterized FAD-dependent dehydrogenase
LIRVSDVRLPLDHAEPALRAAVVARLGIEDRALLDLRVHKRGHDARKRGSIAYVYTLDAAVAGDEQALLGRFAGQPHIAPTPDATYRHAVVAPAGFAAADDAIRPVVVGFGPCGLFAALVLAEAGFRPIVLERGKPVRERTQDTWGLWRRGVLDPESNVQFGEGGAGTFSDGKLWTQIGDPRHLSRKVIDAFIAAGAPEDIAWQARPHIGTFRLVRVVETMRETIRRLGGEVRFRHRLVDLHAAGGRLSAIEVEGPEGERTTLPVRHLVLAPGHSARDTFSLLQGRGVALQAKPFSIGFRIEHPQGVVDRARYGPQAGHPGLGAADYKLVHHASNGRSVYSFCMCPGGTVVAATSEEGRVVTNGMSQYSRNERNANAGIVVGLTPADVAQPGGDGVMDGVAFQRFWERRAFELGGGGYAAPGQRVGDFLAGRASTAFERVVPSYQPAVTPTDLAAPGREALPGYAIEAIREALPVFARKIAGFAMDDAVLTAVETRTSSPVRVLRDPVSRESPTVRGLYPAGEGCGFAGGIMSAAVDGIETAERVAASIAADLRSQADAARRRG